MRNIRSFAVVLYNNRGDQETGRFSVPISVAAPFTNRVIAEALPATAQTTQEPWYRLVPCYHTDPPLHRAVKPAGLTSLYGKHYLPANEPPPRVTLHPEARVRYFSVSILDFETPIYQGDYSVDDIFRAGAEYLARAWIEKGNMDALAGPFYYAVIPSEQEVRTMNADLFPAEAYQVEGVFQLPLLSRDRPRTRFTRLKPDPLPARRPESFGPLETLGRGPLRQNRIFIPRPIYQRLMTELDFSATAEEGGYLLGMPYRQPRSPADEDDPEFSWLLELTHYLPAEATWGSAALLMFTGESWSQVNRRRDIDYPEQKLAAWFHTHLFAASDEFGLSGLDQDLHRRFLTKPWQIAVLLNIDFEGGRELRCFQRGPEGDLVECQYHIFDPGAQREFEG